jgi:hypothetical protein
MAAGLTSVHLRRLKAVWRSAGWPWRDAVELDLLGAGMLERSWDGEGRESLRVTELGIHALAQTRRRHQAALNAHEALVERVVCEMQRAGRIVWRRLSLRVPLSDVGEATVWPVAMPDVYSIRHTTREDWVEPIVHEIKVSRADFLSDLRRPAKGLAYRAAAAQCWYVLRRGIADVDEVPPGFGVMLADDAGLDVARAAPCQAMQLPFAVWITLARSAAEPPPEDGQFPLGCPAD